MIKSIHNYRVTKSGAAIYARMEKEGKEDLDTL
jgi:hypothetical protein